MDCFYCRKNDLEFIPMACKTWTTALTRLVCLDYHSTTTHGQMYVPRESKMTPCLGYWVDQSNSGHHMRLSSPTFLLEVWLLFLEVIILTNSPSIIKIQRQPSRFPRGPISANPRAKRPAQISWMSHSWYKKELPTSKSTRQGCCGVEEPNAQGQVTPTVEGGQI